MDLTQSSESLSTVDIPVYSKSLKTIYFPHRNFNRSVTMRKNLVTTSLINLPVIKKALPKRRLFSASFIKQNENTKASLPSISNKYFNFAELTESDQSNVSRDENSKLSILDIPIELLEPSEMACNREILSKAALNARDQKIIDWILDLEMSAHDNRDCSLFINQENNSIEEFCGMYDVDSSSTFD